MKISVSQKTWEKSSPACEILSMLWTKNCFPLVDQKTSTASPSSFLEEKMEATNIIAESELSSPFWNESSIRLSFPARVKTMILSLSIRSRANQESIGKDRIFEKEERNENGRDLLAQVRVASFVRFCQFWSFFQLCQKSKASVKIA